MFGRRLVILVVVLMGLTALAASVAPPPETPRRTPGGTPPRTPSPATPTPEPVAASEVVVGRLDATPPPGALPRVRAHVGATVRLDVTGDVVDAVVVTGLPAIEPIDPSTPAQLELTPDRPGEFRIRLQDAARDIGVLDVTATG
jgi:hypothetical protein